MDVALKDDEQPGNNDSFSVCHCTLTMLQLPVDLNFISRVISVEAKYNEINNNLSFKHLGRPLYNLVGKHVVIDAENEKGSNFTKVREVKSVALNSNGDTELIFSALPNSIRSKSKRALESFYGKEFESGTYNNATIKSLDPIKDKKTMMALLNTLRLPETTLIWERNRPITAHIAPVKAAIKFKPNPNQILGSGLVTFHVAFKESNRDVFVHFKEEKKLYRAKYTHYLTQLKFLLDNERELLATSKKQKTSKEWDEVPEGLKVAMNINDEIEPRVVKLVELRKSGNYKQTKIWLAKGLMDAFNVDELTKDTNSENTRRNLQGIITFGV